MKRSTARIAARWAREWERAAYAWPRYDANLVRQCGHGVLALGIGAQYRDVQLVYGCCETDASRIRAVVRGWEAPTPTEQLDDDAAFLELSNRAALRSPVAESFPPPRSRDGDRPTNGDTCRGHCGFGISRGRRTFAGRDHPELRRRHPSMPCGAALAAIRHPRRDCCSMMSRTRSSGSCDCAFVVIARARWRAGQLLG